MGPQFSLQRLASPFQLMDGEMGWQSPKDADASNHRDSLLIRIKDSPP